MINDQFLSPSCTLQFRTGSCCMIRPIAIFLLFPFIFIQACMDSTTGNNKKVDPEDIYLDYKVWGEEGNDSVTVMLQFRFGGEYGPTLKIAEPGKVTLDGENVPVDSTLMTGPFYQVSKPVKTFRGRHTILLNSANKRKYKVDFVFRPFVLKTILPGSVSRNRLDFEFEGLDKTDHMRVLLTDTSFLSEGINRFDTVRNNRLSISREELIKLVKGPIQLQFIKEDGRVIENGAPEGGFISVVYSLRREFFLKD